MQLPVPATGLTSVDQRQPGRKTNRPMSAPPTFRISTRPLGNSLTSSAGPNLWCSACCATSSPPWPTLGATPVEWQVTYFHDGLRRFLIFDVSEATSVLVTVSAQAAATDESGRWASAIAASTSLPRSIFLDQLNQLVPQLLDQTRFVANSLGHNDVRPMVVGAFGTG